MSVYHVFLIVQIVPNCAKRLICGGFFPFGRMLPVILYGNNWYEIGKKQYLIQDPINLVRSQHILINKKICLKQNLTQLAFTCSKLTIGTLEKGVKYVQR